jgi:hypothetical protein
MKTRLVLGVIIGITLAATYGTSPLDVEASGLGKGDAERAAPLQ